VETEVKEKIPARRTSLVGNQATRKCKSGYQKQLSPSKSIQCKQDGKANTANLNRNEESTSSVCEHGKVNRSAPGINVEIHAFRVFVS